MMNNGLKKGLAIIFTVVLYVAMLWGLMFLLLIFIEDIGIFLHLFILAATSLLTVFAAELLWCKRLELNWLFVRLLCPFVGNFLFLVTITIYNPMLWMNGMLIFFSVSFVLCQCGLLLLSIISTAIYRKGHRQAVDPIVPSNPKLQSIKLPPKAEREASPFIHSMARPTPQPEPEAPDWKGNILVAVAVVAMLGSMLSILFWFPSYQVAVGLLPAVTQEKIEAKNYYDWRGHRASEDIPVLTSAEQLKDGTREHFTYLTVETDEIIPLGLYKLKDNADSSASTGRGQARSGRRPLQEYETFPTVNAMYYGKYCLVKLQNGSYMGAYLDSSYTTTLGSVQLPIGRVEYANSKERGLLTKAANDYPVVTDSMLVMHSVDNYPDFIKFLDTGIRLGATMLVPGLLLGGSVVIIMIKKRKTSNDSV